MQSWSVILLSSATSLLAVKVGDTEAQVIADLGKPKGTAPLGSDHLFMYYDRGTMLMHRGKVVTVNLSTEEDFRNARLKEEGERRALERQKEAAQREAAQRAAADKRRSRPKLSSETLFAPEPDTRQLGVGVTNLRLGVIQDPAPPPYTTIACSNGGESTTQRNVQTVYPPAPTPTELQIRLMVSNLTDAPISNLNLVYTLRINGGEELPVTVSGNRETVIYPGTCGELEISVKVSGEDDWQRLQDLDGVSFKFFRDDRQLDVSRPSWVRKPE